jgi:hypothetical protein
VRVRGSRLSARARWSLVHLVWFAGLGWLYPDLTARFVLFGVLWELLEGVLSRNTGLRDFWDERGINSLWSAP